MHGNTCNYARKGAECELEGNLESNIGKSGGSAQKS